MISSSQCKQATDSRSDAEYKRQEPEEIYETAQSAGCLLVRKLERRRRDAGEERSNCSECQMTCCRAFFL